MRFVIVLFAVLMIASAANAQANPPVSDCRSTAGVSCPSMKISICPQGDFEQIRNGCGGTNDYIWIVVRDIDGNPIPGIPVTDYWMNACDAAQALYLCLNPIAADSLTGFNGRTTFSGDFRAGGCVLTQGLCIAVQGLVLKSVYPDCATNLCLNVVIKGPDLTGPLSRPNGIVNLSDAVIFGFSLGKIPGELGYNACCDYDGDNICGLNDLAAFNLHYQHRCP
ncbi:MAG: hypothetical protein NTW97_06030 [Candidatus Krumholzibacteria bacterium]|nr:hypothetical protein [Candidatus Krumholzibacteria bacterium]